MKVIILTGEPFPNGMAAVSRIKCYARAMIEGGIECEVLVYRRTEVHGKPAKNTSGRGSSEGVPYQYVGGTPLRGNNVFVRQINDGVDVIKTERYLKRNLSEGDVLFLYIHDSVNVTIRFINAAHSKGASCIRDLCELPYGASKETNMSVRLRERTVRRQFPLLDGVVSISDALMEYAKQWTRKECKHTKVPILVDFDKFSIDDKSKEEPFPYIFHAGTHFEQKDGFLGMLEAFGLSLNRLGPRVRFVSTGSVDDSFHEDEIREIISKYGMDDRVVFAGYLSNDDLKEYLSRASLVVINKYHTQQNHYCFSTKLGEYLAAAKPVIITNVGEAMNWVQDGESAYVIEPENASALSDSIVKVFGDIETAKKIGQAGKMLCRKSFDYHNWSTPLVLFLKEVVNV